jgi:hypothetical protein
MNTHQSYYNAMLQVIERLGKQSEYGLGTQMYRDAMFAREVMVELVRQNSARDSLLFQLENANTFEGNNNSKFTIIPKDLKDALILALKNSITKIPEERICPLSMGETCHNPACEKDCVRKKVHSNPVCLECGHAHFWENEGDVLPWGPCRQPHTIKPMSRMAMCACRNPRYEVKK